MMEIADRISVDPHVHHGAPVITGTRVSVCLIVGSLAAMTPDEIVREYGITSDDVRAALMYAAELVPKTQTLQDVAKQEALVAILWDFAHAQQTRPHNTRRTTAGQEVSLNLQAVRETLSQILALFGLQVTPIE